MSSQNDRRKGSPRHKRGSKESRVGPRANKDPQQKRESEREITWRRSSNAGVRTRGEDMDRSGRNRQNQGNAPVCTTLFQSGGGVGGQAGLNKVRGTLL